MGYLSICLHLLLSSRLDVIDQIIGWEEGKFSYENTDEIGEINIQGDTMGILLDALRRIDEAAAGGPSEG